MIQSHIPPDQFLQFIIRVIAGVLFFFQGYDKVFRMGISQVITTITPSYQRAGFPQWAINAVAILTSWVELLAGALLIFGLFRYEAAYLLCVDLLIVSVGMSIIDPVWDARLVSVRLFLLALFLILPAQYDWCSLDAIFKPVLEKP